MRLWFLLLGRRRGRGRRTRRNLCRLIAVFVKMSEDLETFLIFLNRGGRGVLGFRQLEESLMLRHQLIIIVIIIQTLNPIIILLDLRLLLNSNIFAVVFLVLLLFSLFLCCWRPGGRGSGCWPRGLGLSLARRDARPLGGRGGVRGEGGEALLRRRGAGPVLVCLVLLLLILIALLV